MDLLRRMKIVNVVIYHGKLGDGRETITLQ
jgi:hypothetical protein